MNINDCKEGMTVIDQDGQRGVIESIYYTAVIVRAFDGTRECRLAYEIVPTATPDQIVDATCAAFANTEFTLPGTQPLACARPVAGTPRQGTSH